MEGLLLQFGRMMRTFLVQVLTRLFAQLIGAGLGYLIKTELLDAALGAQIGAVVPMVAGVIVADVIITGAVHLYQRLNVRIALDLPSYANSEDLKVLVEAAIKERRKQSSPVPPITSDEEKENQ